MQARLGALARLSSQQLYVQRAVSPHLLYVHPAHSIPTVHQRCMAVCMPYTVLSPMYRFLLSPDPPHRMPTTTGTKPRPVPSHAFFQLDSALEALCLCVAESLHRLPLMPVLALLVLRVVHCPDLLKGHFHGPTPAHLGLPCRPVGVANCHLTDRPVNRTNQLQVGEVRQERANEGQGGVRGQWVSLSNLMQRHVKGARAKWGRRWAISDPQP